jgi:hypothetical protein
MSDIKWSSFPSIGNLATGDILVGLRAGANVRFSTLTIPWTVPNGGTGNTTATAYALVAGGTSSTGAFQSVSGVGTTGQVLTSNGAAALPTWQSVSGSGAITTINGNAGSVTPTAGAVTINGGTTGLTTSGAASTLSLTGILIVTNGGLGISTTPTNGQIPIGNGANYVSATLTAGTGISITNGSGSITLASLGGGITWTTIAGTTQAAVIDHGYIVGNASQTTITLPATAVVGSVVAVAGQGAAGWILAANAGQTIKIQGGTTSTAGSLTSAEQYDSIQVVCVVADTTWVVTSAITTGFTSS